MDEPFGALDAQTRTRDAGPAAAGARDRGQDGAADHPLGRRGDLPLVADRRRHGAAGAGANDHRRAVLRIRARSRCTRTTASPSCARSIRGLVMEEYEAQAKQAVAGRGSLATPIDRSRRREQTRTDHRPRTGDDHDPSPQNPSSGRRRRRHRSARRLRRQRLRAGAHQAARRLPAHARGRRPDLARPAVGRVDQARPRHGADPVHDRPRAVPGDDRRQPRRALDRRRRLQLPGARPGPRLPAQQHRVRDRAALGPRRLDQVDRRPEGQADRDDDRHHRARLPRPRAALGQARPGQGRADRQPAHGRGGDLVRLRRRARGRALGAVRPDGEAEGRRTRARSSTRRRSSREAAIMGGWAARNDFYDANKPALASLDRRLGRGQRRDARQLRRRRRDAAEDAVQGHAARRLPATR